MKHLSSQRGFSLVEIMVSCAILGIGAFIFGKTLIVQNMATDRTVNSMKGQRYEGLLRAQLFKTAMDEIDQIGKDGSCPGLKTLNDNSPAEGPRFRMPIMSPLRALWYINYMSRLHKPDGEEDGRGTFAHATAKYCALKVINRLNAGDYTPPLSRLNCILLKDYTNAKILEYVTKVSFKYYDFATQKQIQCTDWATATSPGIKMDYTMIWTTGKHPESKKDVVTAKTGFLEIQ